jgi:phosphopentomutase
VEVHGVGKIHDLFAGVGVDVKHAAATNARGIAATTALLRELDAGLVFVNVVETDQVYGHRHDVDGFHHALRAIDAAADEWLDLRDDEDLLVLTADHGVDPWRRTRTTRASTRRCSPSSAATPGAATTARSPMSAPACCAGSPAATPRTCLARRSSHRPASAPL